MTRSKRDGNEAAILRGLHAIGAWYCQMDRDAGFDLIVAFRGRLFVVEIKNPAVPPSDRRLLPSELQRAVELQRVGVDYWKCETLDEVLHAIGATP